ncbi:glycoside hydrolase family 140 protein [Spirosoma montaniterrae]|uniref:Glycoside hydrolase n=1 Tax=Spirosoma montaniterrae TaxID=1178516 RepID=A0A1P9WZ34_9BACT|nr:glycoside hydrolase family 140 protein [Spirosoma montaniterrae]AQG80623.1 hypothetical protein AWR27_15605 [Spirosoma montaniterrae]
MQRIRVSDNHRFLVHNDGTPFFWLGDTAWELFHRLTRDETDLYLQNRAHKGFTVIQAVVLAELDGLRVPNANGDVPLIEVDPTQPNEAYFQHVDWVIDRAASLGLYVGLLPTWGDKVNQRYDWAKGPEVFNESNAAEYGTFLGNRYRNRLNIIWILGGDRDPDERAVAIWRAMATGILKGVGRRENALMTFHPQPFESGSSSRWFHDDEWLSLNMLQTGHDRHKNTFEQITADYNRLPAKPVLDGEPTYEAHGLSFKPFENGYSSDAEVRKFAYWALFSGACGHTYGCHSIWQFYAPGREGINFPIYYWTDALDLAGASQMRHLSALMTRPSITDRIPDQSLLAGHQPKDDEYIVATRTTDGRFVLVYTPTGRTFGIDTRELAGESVCWHWFNPRDGSETVPQTVPKTAVLSFQPPNSGYGHDWVLLLSPL